MVRTRHHTAVVHGMLIGSVFEHPTVWEFIGEKKYLQVAVSKAVAKAYASKFGAITTKKLSCIAARDGSMSLLVWARYVGCDWSETVFLAAVEGTQIAVLQFLLDHECPIPTGTEAFALAAEIRDLQTLEFLYENNFEWDAATCSAAARVNWLEGLQWLRAHNCPWDTTTRYCSAGGGHLQLYKWAHVNGCPGDHSYAVSDAVETCQLEFLKWLLEDGFVFHDGTYDCAAFCGQLNVIKWLRTHNVPWSSSTILAARLAGHSAVERWAIENGCPQHAEEE